MQIWLLASRPKTLGATLVPILLVTSWYLGRDGFSTHLAAVSFFATVSALMIQIATNLFNDVLDFKKGADSASRKGPPRMAAMGHLSPQQLYKAAFGCLLVALIAGIPLVYWGGWWIVGLGLISLFLAYGYTGGPFPLAYLGLGEFFVILFFGLVPVSTLAFLFSGEFSEIWNPMIITNGLIAGMCGAVLIAINNLRDLNEDQVVGKKTLAVLLGETLFHRLILVFFAFSYLFLVPIGLVQNSLLYLIPLFSLVSAFSIIRGLSKKSPDWTFLLAKSGQWSLIYGLLLSVAHLL